MYLNLSKLISDRSRKVNEAGGEGRDRGEKRKRGGWGDSEQLP